MDRMKRMKSLKLISREDARTAKRVKILTRKDFAGFFFGGSCGDWPEKRRGHY
jgi:hypothetical protein